MLSVICMVLLVSALNAQSREYYMGLYVGKATHHNLEVLFIPRYSALLDSKIVAVGIAKKLYESKNYEIWMESNGVKHFGYQTHLELNFAFLFKWKSFPWDNYLDTSFVIGDGFSYATQKPQIEIDDNGKSAKILNYLIVEWKFYPIDQEYSIYTRIHHRSGIYGRINDVSGGSNFVTIGFRNYFDR